MPVLYSAGPPACGPGPELGFAVAFEGGGPAWEEGGQRFELVQDSQVIGVPIDERPALERLPSERFVQEVPEEM